MERLEPLSHDALPEFEAFWQAMEATLGFVPNSLLIMAHKPDLLGAFSALAQTVLNPENPKTPVELKHLIGHVASTSAGCRYCQAHTAKNASAGLGPDRIENVWDYERSPLFSEAERAALRIAQAAGSTPNAVTNEDFMDLRDHFDPEAVIEIVAVISLFGWLNRWNDTFATELEQEPLETAEQLLGDRGWSAGKHGRQDKTGR